MCWFLAPPGHQQTLHWSYTWWRHQMETFFALLVICAGNSPVPGEFPTQRPVARSFDVFFDLLPNKRLSKHWRGWWFETPSCPLWRHCNIRSTCPCFPQRIISAGCVCLSVQMWYVVQIYVYVSWNKIGTKMLTTLPLLIIRHNQSTYKHYAHHLIFAQTCVE